MYNGSKKEEIGHCDGTLLTEKIILSAGHCCRPSLLWSSIAMILPQLVSEKCELQKCQGNLVNEECMKAITQCGLSQLLKCGINMDANEECKELNEELSYYLNMMTKLTYLKNATVEAG